ncbi:hypothetical protein ABZP36_003520 [Zizania latifolia]
MARAANRWTLVGMVSWGGAPPAMLVTVAQDVDPLTTRSPDDTLATSMAFLLRPSPQDPQASDPMLDELRWKGPNPGCFNGGSVTSVYIRHNTRKLSRISTDVPDTFGSSRFTSGWCNFSYPAGFLASNRLLGHCFSAGWIPSGRSALAAAPSSATVPYQATEHPSGVQTYDELYAQGPASTDAEDGDPSTS